MRLAIILTMGLTLVMLIAKGCETALLAAFIGMFVSLGQDCNR